MRFVVEKVALGQAFLPVLRISPSFSFFQCFQPILTLLLLFPEGQVAKPGNFQRTSHPVHYIYILYAGGFHQRVKQLYRDSNNSLCTASRLRNRGCPLPLPYTSLCMVRDVSERRKLHGSPSLSNAARHPQEHCLF